jgi:hypothetical protein
VREAEANPSYVVLQAWEQLSGAIADLVGVAFPNPSRRVWLNPFLSLPDLRKRELVTADFANAVIELRQLRNQEGYQKLSSMIRRYTSGVTTTSTTNTCAASSTGQTQLDAHYPSWPGGVMLKGLV